LSLWFIEKFVLVFRINEFTRLLKKVNDSCYKVNANCLTLCLNVRTSATYDADFA